MTAVAHRRDRPGRASDEPAGLTPSLLGELRAALAAGASPAAAMVAAADSGPLAEVGHAVRRGRGLADVATTVRTGDAAADLLVRALGVVERTGSGAGEAVEQAAAAVREEAALRRLLGVRTAQARGTAVVLAGVPVVGWVLLVGIDRSALAFYTRPLGMATALLALVLAGASQWWSRRIIAASQRAGAEADPLAATRAEIPVGPLVTAAGAAFVVGAVIGGLGSGIAVAVSVALLVWRRERRRDDGRQSTGAPDGGAAEAVELVAIALAGGLAVGQAVDLVAGLAPSRAQPVLAAAARRLRNGWTADAAFAGGGLERLGDVLAAAGRWGAPAETELQRLAADLRAERRAAAEEAAERTQLALVFPTTLLALPAFVLGVVPPLLWTALTG